MAKDKPEGAEPTDPVMAMIRTQRAALDALEASWKAAKAAGLNFGAMTESGTPSTPGQGVFSAGPAIELPRGALMGKSIPAAIKLYLSAVKQKLTMRDIAAALTEGGVESTSSNFEGTVTSALNRLKSAGEVLRFKDGWALAELYPESLRSRIAEKDAKPKKVKRRKSKGEKPAKMSPRAAKAEGGTKGAPDLAQRIEAFLRSAGKPIEAGAVTAAMGVAGNVVGLALGRLRKQNRIKKDANGLFSVA